MLILLISRRLARHLMLSTLLLTLSAALSSPATAQKQDVRRPPVQTRTSVALQVNIAYGDEDQQIVPVADADFYLLDASLIELLKAAQFKPVFPDQKNRSLADGDFLEAAAATLLSGDGGADDGGGGGGGSEAIDGGDEEAEVEVAAFLIRDLLRRHSTPVIKTNRLGDGRLLTAVPGRRYLFGIGRSGGQTVVWHLPVVIKAGFNEINLDQNDAELIF